MKIDSYNLYKIRKRYFIFGGVVVIAAALGVYFYIQNLQAKSLSQSQNQPLRADSTGDLIAQIQAVMDVPKDETPVIASVTDSDKVKGTAFLAQAENGDKILVYRSIKKAILFRPSTGKIIEVAPVTDDSSPEASASASASAATVQAVNVVIRNGTSTKGLALQNKAKIEALGQGIKVIKTENAAKANYKQTLVIALKPENKALALQIAQSLKGEVEDSLPQGESTGDDINIVVILGGE